VEGGLDRIFEGAPLRSPPGARPFRPRSTRLGRYAYKLGAAIERRNRVRLLGRPRCAGTLADRPGRSVPTQPRCRPALEEFVATVPPPWHADRHFQRSYPLVPVNGHALASNNPPSRRRSMPARPTAAVCGFALEARRGRSAPVAACLGQIRRLPLHPLLYILGAAVTLDEASPSPSFATMPRNIRI
jgi:hypothetical protein